MFPPGQAATTIRPSAIEGLGWAISSMTKVTTGNTMNCENSPTRRDFGALSSLLKSPGVRSMAIENMTIASTALRICSDVGLKFRTTSSMLSTEYPSKRIAGCIRLFSRFYQGTLYFPYDFFRRLRAA